MPKNTTSKKTARTKPQSKTTPTPTRAKPSTRTMTWNGTERAPRKRWWWWATMIYLTVLGVAVAINYHQWMLAALIVVMAIALLAAYGSKPRTRQYKLTGTTLTIDDTNYDLTRFDRSVEEDPWAGDNNILPGTTLLLLPKARLGVPLSVFLPDDDTDKKAITAALGHHVKPMDASSYKGTLRFFDYIARLLQL